MKNCFILDKKEFEELMIDKIHTMFCLKEININERMSINDFRNKNDLSISKIIYYIKEEYGFKIEYDLMNEAIEIYFKTAKFRNNRTHLTS